MVHAPIVQLDGENEIYVVFDYYYSFFKINGPTKINITVTDNLLIE